MMLSLLQYKYRRAPRTTIAALLALVALSAALLNLSLVDNDNGGVDDRRQLSGGYTIEHPKTFALRSLQVQQQSALDNGNNDVVFNVDGNGNQLRRLSGGLVDPKTVEPRRAAVIEEEATADADTVVLLTVSGGFFDMWMNWLTFFEKLAIPDLPVLLFPEDEQAHQKCLQQVKDMAADDDTKYHADLTCLPWNFAFSEDNKIEDDVGALSYGTDGYKVMMARRPAIIQKELESGHNVIFSDADVVWKKNPLPYIKEQLDEAHILAASDMKNVLCPGFMIYKSSPETIAFVDLWRKRLKGQVSSNQGPFNILLRKVARHQIKIDLVTKVLPGKLYANGKMYFKNMKEEEREKVVVVHNNFIVGYKEKVDRMKRFGLWEVEEQ